MCGLLLAMPPPEYYRAMFVLGLCVLGVAGVVVRGARRRNGKEWRSCRYPRIRFACSMLILYPITELIAATLCIILFHIYPSEYAGLYIGFLFLGPAVEGIGRGILLVARAFSLIPEPVSRPSHALFDPELDARGSFEQ